MDAGQDSNRVSRISAIPDALPLRDSQTAATIDSESSLLFRAKSARSRQILWICFALIVANLFVYGRVGQFGFVNFDDPEYVSDNQHLSSGLTWHSVSWALTADYAGNWFPLTWLSFLLDFNFYGLKAGGYHLTNLLLHIANTLLLFGFLNWTTGAAGRSAFVAGLFAVHPLHVESVAWVTERKDVLSTLFGLLALWMYVRYVRQPRVGRYLIVLLLFALSLMAKPMLVTLPALLLLLDFWPLSRWPHGNTTGPPGLRRLILEKVPLFALSLASSIVTLIVQQRGGAVATLDTLPLSFRVQNATISYIAYIGKTLWPAQLAAFYPMPRSWPPLEVVGAAMVLICVSIGVSRLASRQPFLLVGWLWFLVTLIPVIGLVQVGVQSMADRYTYFPLIGLFVVAAWGMPELHSRWPHTRTASSVAGALVIVTFGIAARAQVEHWNSSAALWTHALEVTAENDFAHNNLGNALADQGKIEEAVAHYNEALRIKPDFAQAHSSLANALASQGKMGEAIVHYRQALRIQPGFAEAHNNLGAALAGQGELQEATAQYQEALRIRPDYSDAHYNLGNSLASRGNLSDAIAQYQEALRLRPDYVDAHINFGGALASQGKLDEAIAHYNQALRINPSSAAAHSNLGIVLASQGKTDEAIGQYEQALSINPNYADAHNNLGSALARQGKLDEAIAHYNQALRTNPSSAATHSNLGAALARQKRYEEAAVQFSQALQFDPDNQTAREWLDSLKKQGIRVSDTTRQ